MWDCENCGTKAIAQSLGDCPACGVSRPKESAVAEPTSETDKSGAFPAGKSGGSATAKGKEK